MLNNKLKKLLKRRIISSMIDILIFSLSFSFSFAISIDKVSPNIWILTYPIIFFILYYSIIPKISGGYTLAGYITGMQIVKFDNSKITLFEYMMRAMYAVFAFFAFLGYSRVKVNSKAQFFFDKPFDILVKDSDGIEIDKEDEEYIYYFLME